MIGAMLALVSLVLLALAVAARFRPLDAVATIPAGFTGHPVGGRTRAIAAASELDRLPGETDEAFVMRVYQAIAAHMVHYSSGGDDPVPARVNWLLALLRFTGLRYFRSYEFQDGRRAIARGYGLCSQLSLALRYFLERGGVHCDVVCLQEQTASGPGRGHVLNEVCLSDGRKLVVDADYGRVVPTSLAAFQRDPALQDEVYTWTEPWWADMEWKENLRVIFASPAQVVDPKALRLKRGLEDLLIAASWLVPLAGLALGLRMALA